MRSLESERTRAPTGPYSVAYGVRAAGLVIAVGALAGLEGTNAVDVAVGLGLVALGRSILAPRESDPAFLAVALMLLWGAAAVVVARWGSSQLADIRGAQAVLGPTLAVGVSTTVATAVLAAAGGFLGLVLWTGDAQAAWSRRSDRAWLWAEVGAAGWFLVTLFAGPAIVWDGALVDLALSVVRWGGLSAILATSAVGTSLLLRRRIGLRSVIAGLGAALVVASAAVLGVG